MPEATTALGDLCPECGKGHLVALVRTEVFEFDLGDEKVRVRAENVPIRKCDHCGEELTGPVAAKIRHEAICLAAGFLAPSGYKEIRDNLGWSQQYMADVTGISVATIGRVEQGRLLPSRIFNNTLLLMRDRPSSREYLEERHRLQLAKKTGDQPSGSVAPLPPSEDAAKRGSGDESTRSRKFRSVVPDKAQVERSKTWRPRALCAA